MKLPEIIGIAGTNGAGKDELADLRREREGARKASLSDILRIEATKRGLAHEREHLRDISTEWGRQFGAGALSLMTLQNYWQTRTDAETGISIVSVRRPMEAQVIQDNGGLMIWVDADRELRYERITGASCGRVDDGVSFEEFCTQEDIEMHPNSEDPFILNMTKVRDRSDVHITNEFASVETYRDYLADRFDLTQ